MAPSAATRASGRPVQRQGGSFPAENRGEFGVIVLVHWQIRPECEPEFLNYWRTSAVVRDRAGLMGEFLSRVTPYDPTYTPWITWAFASGEPDTAAHYVNVGMWSSEDMFLLQVSGDFGDAEPIRPFELLRRRRLLLTPQAWRIGDGVPPRNDSAGVL